MVEKDREGSINYGVIGAVMFAIILGIIGIVVAGISALLHLVMGTAMFVLIVAIIGIVFLGAIGVSARRH